MVRFLCVLIAGMILCPSISTAVGLNGVVLDAEKSAPLPGASVFVDVLIPDSITFSTLSDSSGKYSLTGMPAGNSIYVIRCHVPGFVDLYMRYDALALGDRQIDLLMYPQQAPPGDGGGDSTAVSGTVLYETAGGARNPVALATVTLRSAGDQVSARTDVDGQYSIRLRRASYNISVEAPNYETLTTGGVSVDSAGLTLNILLKTTPVAVTIGSYAVPVSFVLENAYPNPFNPTTLIRYHLPVASDVRLVVLDYLGREIVVLVNESKAAGSHEAMFDAGGLASGLYLYRLTARDFSGTRKIILIR